MAFPAPDVASVGLCGCGCGEKTRLAPYTTRRLGWVKGRPIRYVNGHCARGTGTGWHFEKTKNRMYVVGRDGSRTLWYRLLMGNMIGRPLRADEEVHHRNGDSSDDRPENLELITVRAHRKLHQPRWTHCKRGHPMEGDNVYVDKRGFRMCKVCDAERGRRRRQALKVTA